MLALAVLRRPMPPAALPFAAAAIALAVALYCLAYTWLAGRPETVGQALAWSAVNAVPWFLAFEAAKRCRSHGGRAGVLAAVFLVSLALDLSPDIRPGEAAFEAARRVPALLLVVLLLWLGRLGGSAGAAGPGEPIELPLLPEQIDWVAAAGNYVEIRCGGRTVLHRASLTALERRLAGHGFVRIHRSRLVRRARIARIRRHDVVLHDGTSLKVGKRYRAALEA